MKKKQFNDPTVQQEYDQAIPKGQFSYTDDPYDAERELYELEYNDHPVKIWMIIFVAAALAVWYFNG